MLKSRVESHHFQVKKTNSFLPQNLFGLWPTATNVVVLRPHQTKRKPTAVPSWITQPPRNIFKQRKGRHGVDPAFNFISILLRPYSKMLTLPIGHPWPTKASLTSCQAHAIFFNGLNFNVESVHFQVKKTNSFMTQSLFQIWTCGHIIPDEKC